MKKHDLVKLVNINNQYKQNNLYIGLHGIILTTRTEFSTVLFFNENNFGDYAIVEINNKDLALQKETLPDKYKKELLNLSSISNLTKSKLNPMTIKENDLVELLVEKDKYLNYKINKGDTGVVMENYAIQNEVLVDFSGVDDNGNYYGDCISVNIKDIKKLN